MILFIIALVYSGLLDFFDLSRQSDRKKDLEILRLKAVRRSN